MGRPSLPVQSFVRAVEPLVPARDPELRLSISSRPCAVARQRVPPASRTSRAAGAFSFFLTSVGIDESSRENWRQKMEVGGGRDLAGLRWIWDASLSCNSRGEQ